MTNKTKKNDKLSAEQICKILHISKRKCAWMLQNGMIHCKDTGKKTRRYTILLNDVLTFKTDYETHPEKYFIPIMFTAGVIPKQEKAILIIFLRMRCRMILGIGLLTNGMI